MEAKDTVMSMTQIEGLFTKTREPKNVDPSDHQVFLTMLKNLCNIQAEVSFKAGQDARDCEWDEWKDKYLPQVIRDSRKEVVEWIDKHHEWGFSDNPKTMNYDKVLLVSQLEWQAFKKERGL